MDISQQQRIASNPPLANFEFKRYHPEWYKKAVKTVNDRGFWGTSTSSLPEKSDFKEKFEPWMDIKLNIDKYWPGEGDDDLQFLQYKRVRLITQWEQISSATEHCDEKIKQLTCNGAPSDLQQADGTHQSETSSTQSTSIQQKSHRNTVSYEPKRISTPAWYSRVRAFQQERGLGRREPDLQVFAGDDLSSLSVDCTCAKNSAPCSHHSSSAWEGLPIRGREGDHTCLRMPWLREQWKLFERGLTMKLGEPLEPSESVSGSTEELANAEAKQDQELRGPIPVSALPQWYFAYREQYPPDQALNPGNFENMSDMGNECLCQVTVKSGGEYHERLLEDKPHEDSRAIDFYKLRELREDEKVAKRSDRLEERFEELWSARDVDEMDELPKWYTERWRGSLRRQLENDRSERNPLFEHFGPGTSEFDDDLSSLRLSEVERGDDDAWQKYCACLEAGIDWIDCKCGAFQAMEDWQNDDQIAGLGSQAEEFPMYRDARIARKKEILQWRKDAEESARQLELDAPRKAHEQAVAMHESFEQEFAVRYKAFGKNLSEGCRPDVLGLAGKRVNFALFSARFMRSQKSASMSGNLEMSISSSTISKSGSDVILSLHGSACQGVVAHIRTVPDFAREGSLSLRLNDAADETETRKASIKFIDRNFVRVIIPSRLAYQVTFLGAPPKEHVEKQTGMPKNASKFIAFYGVRQDHLGEVQEHMRNAKRKAGHMTTDDEAVRKRLKIIKPHSRMSESSQRAVERHRKRMKMQSARAKERFFEAHVTKRAEKWKRYYGNSGELPELKLLKGPRTFRLFSEQFIKLRPQTLKQSRRTLKFEPRSFNTTQQTGTTRLDMVIGRLQVQGSWDDNIVKLEPFVVSGDRAELPKLIELEEPHNGSVRIEFVNHHYLMVSVPRSIAYWRNGREINTPFTSSSGYFGEPPEPGDLTFPHDAPRHILFYGVEEKKYQSLKEQFLAENYYYKSDGDDDDTDDQSDRGDSFDPPIVGLGGR